MSAPFCAILLKHAQTRVCRHTQTPLYLKFDCIRLDKLRVYVIGCLLEDVGMRDVLSLSLASSKNIHRTSVILVGM